MRIKKNGALALAACFIAVCLQALPALGSAEGTFQRTLQVTGPVSLDLTTGSGNVNVRTGGSGQVRVTGHVKVTNWFGSGSEEQLKKITDNPPIQQSGNDIRIGNSGDSDMFHNISISYDLVVPADTRLHSHTGSGNQDIEGLNGVVEADSGSGKLKISQVGNTVRAETGSGGMELRRIDGSLEASAGSGEISADGNPAGAWSVRTGSGSVCLKLASSAAFDLDAHTSSGSISVSQPVTVQGTIGRKELRGKVHGGGVPVEVKTGSGNIEIE